MRIPMIDFLTFQTFITPSLLILMYYMGAILIPIVSWYLARWIQKSYFSEVSKSIKKEIGLNFHVQKAAHIVPA